MVKGITGKQYEIIQEALSDYRWNVCCENRKKILDGKEPDNIALDEIDELKNELWSIWNKEVDKLAELKILE